MSSNLDQSPNAIEQQLWDMARKALAGQRQILGAMRNRAFITNGSTTNAQGAGGPTIIALAALNAKVSGVFAWSISFFHAAAAADIVTVTVQTQTNVGGIGVLTTTNPSFATATNGCITATGVAGTGIAITAGGGGATTLAAPSFTQGTAATGVVVSLEGMTAVNVGSSCILTLAVTNSVANRANSSICITLAEQP